MEITKEEVEKRLNQALQTKSEKIVEANIAEGIIQDCKHWLSVLETLEGAKNK